MKGVMYDCARLVKLMSNGEMIQGRAKKAKDQGSLFDKAVDPPKVLQKM